MTASVWWTKNGTHFSSALERVLQRGGHESEKKCLLRVDLTIIEPVLAVLLDTLQVLIETE